MRYSRSHRRHHYERLIAKRRKENTRYGVSTAINESEWRFKNPRVRARTGCPCSCSMCGNPRRHYGNSAGALTRQELRPWD